MPKHFIKVKQDFICNHCDYKTTGTGYTNHCPHCLYSKHVDQLTPGDRQSTCQGLMKPLGLQIKSSKSILFHQCLKCSKITRNKTASNDSQEKLLKLSQTPLKTKK